MLIQVPRMTSHVWNIFEEDVPVQSWLHCLVMSQRPNSSMMLLHYADVLTKFGSWCLMWMLRQEMFDVLKCIECILLLSTTPPCYAATKISHGHSGSLALKESALTMLSIACAGEDWGFAGLLERKHSEAEGSKVPDHPVWLSHVVTVWTDMKRPFASICYHFWNSHESVETVKAWWFFDATGSRASKRDGLYVRRTAMAMAVGLLALPLPVLPSEPRVSRRNAQSQRSRGSLGNDRNDARWCRS